MLFLLPVGEQELQDGKAKSLLQPLLKNPGYRIKTPKALLNLHDT
jgi:hypothetical protein